MNRSRRELPTIGWREWLRLPDLDVDAIKAKVDTGARSSALHAFDVEHFDRNGSPWVRFAVHPLQRSSRQTVTAEAPLHEHRWVKNSGGREQLRPVIVTRAALLDLEWPIELTLTNRDVMGFRMLLGRQAIRRRFLVDPGHSFLGGRLRKPSSPEKT